MSVLGSDDFDDPQSDDYQLCNWPTHIIFRYFKQLWNNLLISFNKIKNANVLFDSAFLYQSYVFLLKPLKLTGYT